MPPRPTPTAEPPSRTDPVSTDDPAETATQDSRAGWPDQPDINLDAEAITVEGITPAQADQIPGAQVVARVCDDAAGTCTVSRRIDRTPAQNDVGNQLVTTVSMLVVAISAFSYYVGSVQTASAARRVVREGENDARPGPS
jgi:hypothetical protein